MLKIVIDPGHYTNYNAGVAAGYYEGNRVFDLARLLKAELEKNTNQVEAIMTKKTPAFLYVDR